MRPLRTRMICTGLALVISLSIQGGNWPAIAADATQSSPAQTQSLTAFADAIQTLTKQDDTAALFDTLVYRPAENQLYQDGVAVGTTCGNLSVVDHTLMLTPDPLPQRAMRTRAESTETAATPLLPCAETWGYDVSVTADEIALTNDFQTARLIVKAPGSVDPLGAVSVVEGFQNLHILQYETSADAYAAYQIYQADNNVTYVQPSRYASVCGEAAPQYLQPSAADAPADPTYQTWGGTQIGTYDFLQTYLSDVVLPETIVAVVDTGINAGHAMVAGRILPNGVNFSNSGDDSPNDDYGHGTHCSGTICELTPSAVKILPIKTFDKNGKAAEEQIYAALLYAIAQGANLINMSFGGLGVSPLEAEAMAMADAKGIICCAAAGNSSDDARYFYPGGIASCITVSAVDAEMQLGNFSNFGPMVDVCAPGVKIRSAILGDNNEMDEWDGTSMATPHVTACCAMLRLYDPELSPRRAETLLTLNAIDLGDVGFDDTYAWGFVSMRNFQWDDGRCATPIFSQKGGNFGHSISVGLSCDTPDAVVYYTTDGSLPTAETGQRYTTELTIEHTTRLRAVAIKPSYQNSLIAETVYAIGGLDVPNAFTFENGVCTAYHGVVANLTIPETWDGQPVVAIGAGAFQGNTYVQTVTLPDSVETIGDAAFQSCTNLQTISAPAVHSIGAQAFAQCGKLQSVSLQPTLQQLGAAAFADCASLKELDLTGIPMLPADACTGCAALTTIAIPTATQIGAGSFAGCTALTTVRCNWQSITSLGTRALADCPRFAGDLRLIALEAIGEAVFSGDAALSSVSLPATITSLPDATFAGCVALKRLSLPGVTVIGAEALAVGQDTFGLETDCDFAKLTSIGADAFRGFPLGAAYTTVNCASLTTLSPYAFAGVIANALVLPQITNVPSHAFDNAHIGVLHLERASTLDSLAIDGCRWVVLSDECTRIAEDAIDPAVGIYCANAACIAGQYATDHKHPTLHIIDVQASYGTTSHTRQYSPEPLAVTIIGDAVTYQWYRVAEDGTETLIADANAAQYTPPVATIGTFSFLCIAKRGDTQTIRTHFTRTVTPFLPPAISCNTPVYSTDSDAQSWLFTPQSANDYWLAFTGDTDPLVTLTEPDGTVLPVNGQSRAFALRADTSYLVTVEPTCVGAYSLCIRDTAPTGTPLAAGWMEALDVFYESDGAAFQPPVTLQTESGVTLRQGQDYTVLYRTHNGRGMAYAFGMGDYSGYAATPYTVYTLLQADVPQAVSLDSEEDSVRYCFVPKETATYSYYATYTEGYLAERNAYLATGSIPKGAVCYGINPSASITDEAGNLLASNSMGGYQKLFRGKVKLLAGQRYYITCTATTAAQYHLVLSQTICDLSRATITGLGYMAYDGTVQSPRIAAALKQTTLIPNVDYVQVNYATDVPGEAVVAIVGIGRYIGSAERTYKVLYTGDDTTVDTPVALGTANDLPFQEQRTARIWFQAQSAHPTATEDMYRIAINESNRSKVCYSIYRWEQPTRTYSLVTTGTGTDDVSLADGLYCIIFYQTFSACKQTATATVLRPCNLEEATVTVADQLYTGNLTKPAFSVIVDGVELAEEVDYTVSYADNQIMFGEQRFTLEASTTSYGSYSGIYHITVSLPTDAPFLTTGTHSCAVTADERLAIYRFVPQTDGDYLLATSDVMDVVLRAFATDGEMLAQCYGTGEQYTMFSAKAGTTYYIMAKFNGVLREGTLSFRLDSDYRLLSDCTASVATMYWTGSAITPDVTFYDGTYRLIEGVDYELRYCNDQVNIGTAIAHYRGIGAYFGNCDQTFSIVAPDLFAVEELTTFPTMLDEVYHADQETPCDYLVYRYTSGLATTVEVNVYEVRCALTLQRYDAQGQFVEYLTTTAHAALTFDMAAGETAYFLISATDICSWNQNFFFSVNEENDYKFQLRTDTGAGIQYRVCTALQYAEPYRLLPNDNIVRLSDTYGTIPLTFFQEALFASCPADTIVYGFQDCPVAAYADVYPFVYLIPTQTEGLPPSGDLNHDGRTSMADVVLLQAFVTERPGLTLSDEQAQQADVQTDGVCNLYDVLALLQRLATT